jgi:hypothetical protein
MQEYKVVDWGVGISGIQNARGNPLFKTAELKWSKPVVWRKGDQRPTIDTTEPIVYALVRNHGKSKEKDHIEYIGLTIKPQSRFRNHPTAREIVDKSGEVKFTYAPIDFVRGRNRIENTKRALQEIEHLLIWTVWQQLYNEKKQFTLPGMGKNGGNAWWIVNTGFRFSGRMPREIVYPWLLMKPGRNRTRKAPAVGITAAAA